MIEIYKERERETKRRRETKEKEREHYWPLLHIMFCVWERKSISGRIMNV